MEVRVGARECREADAGEEVIFAVTGHVNN